MKLIDKVPVFKAAIGLDTRCIHKVSEEALEDSDPRRFVTDFWLTAHEGHCELWIYHDKTGAIVHFDERGRQTGAACMLHAEAAQTIRVALQSHRAALAQGKVDAKREQLHNILHSIGLNPTAAPKAALPFPKGDGLSGAIIQSEAPAP